MATFETLTAMVMSLLKFPLVLFNMTYKFIDQINMPPYLVIINAIDINKPEATM